MGGNSSKDNSWRQNSSVQRSSSSASSWSQYPEPAYGQGGYPYEPQQSSYPTQQQYYDAPPHPPPNYDDGPYAGGRVARHDDRKKLERKYSRIADNYNSIDEVRKAVLYVVYVFN